jgi:Ca-activated chloride channel family protein
MGWIDRGIAMGRTVGLLLLMLLLGGQAAAETNAGLYLARADGQAPLPAPALQTAVDIDVVGMLARVEVKQRFENRSPDWVEGVYVFPLPDDAAVDTLRMVYGGRLIEGEVQEKERASETYARARAAGQGASLLDQERANVFTAAVANIPPGEAVEITIAYRQEAQWRDDGYALRFPMVVAPRYIPGAAAGRRPAGPGWARDTDEVPDASRITPPVVIDADSAMNPLTLTARLNVGLPLASVDSPYHAIRVQTSAPGRYRVDLAADSVPAERDFVLRWQPEADSQPGASLFAESWQDEHFALLALMPPRSLPDERVPRELILVVDVSGSMHGDSIDQARAALALALKQLRPIDRFNIIRFNDRVHSLFVGSRPADAHHLRLADDYVSALHADGGTEMVPAMRLALRSSAASERLRQVVFLTDGAIGNEQALFDLILADVGNSRLFPVGIGSAPNALLMRKAARLGRGSFSYIGSSDEVTARMQSLFARLDAPLLTDVELDWHMPDGTVFRDQVPKLVPDLYAGEPLTVALRSQAPVRGVTVSGRLGGQVWTQTLDLRAGAQAQGVRLLWARRAIDDWLARRRLGVDAETVRAEVVEIALRHGLVSQFTSLVAVDRSPVRDPETPLRRAAVPVHLPAGWSATAVFGSLPGTATPAALAMLFGGAALALAFGLRRR